MRFQLPPRKLIAAHLNLASSSMSTPVIYRSTAISSGSLTLDERSTCTQSCGSSSSSTGKCPIRGVQGLASFSGVPAPTAISIECNAIPFSSHTAPSRLRRRFFLQARARRQVRPEAMANRRDCLQDWSALLPLLVSGLNKWLSLQTLTCDSFSPSSHRNFVIAAIRLQYLDIPRAHPSSQLVVQLATVFEQAKRTT